MVAKTRSPAAQRPRPAHAVFFPAAVLYGAVVLPLSVQSMLGGWSVPGLATGLGHGHEMLFGYALAVVAGYLLGPTERGRLWGMLALWLLARGSFLLAPGSLLAVLPNAAFALVLAGQVAPKFLGAAKKLRNQAFAPVLIAICIAAALVPAVRHFGMAWAQHVLLLEAVLLFALLLLFMGGRVIAPAAAGQRARQGEHLEARVQPRIEGGLIVAMALAVVAAPFPALRLPAAAVVATAGLLALIRLYRWELWRCRARVDLICLGIGYAWLAIGLLVLAASLAAAQHLTTSLHILTVGALGTLTTGVMGRVRLQRAKLDPGRSITLPASALLMAVAVVARVLGGAGAADVVTAYWLAALAWSAAMLLLARLLFRVPAR